MKKRYVVFLAAAAVLALGGCSTISSRLNYDAPEFAGPFSYVVDAAVIPGSVADYVKTHNRSNDSNINFNVYAHDAKTKQWILIGPAFLKGWDDTDTVDTYIHNLYRYRYYAVEPLNNKAYDYKVYKRHNDLHIDILSK